ADGRARIVPVAAPAPVPVDDRFPLRLNTGRYRDQWHTMTRTGLSSTLSQHRREALLEIHPADAAACGLSNDGLARVTTAAGAALFRVCLTEAQRPGEIFVPMHWSDAMASEARANRLSLQEIDAISGQPGFKNTPARVEPVSPDWCAFLASRDSPPVSGVLWWSRSRVRQGWLFELAGAGDIAVDPLLPSGDKLEVADLARGMRRIVVRNASGALQAALYVTRSGELPPRDWIAEQLGSNEAAGSELLAGRPCVPLPDRGPIVCVCHGIAERTIREAAGAGAVTVDAIGRQTGAGTNCGSCRPAMARLLDDCLMRQREAAQ
ncbi:MAG: (2Fe-2S)-binding protein, partial [Novosphingobium sp.]|nr:(2Fe-2S)-binding protein [Novosphingobium sp.]